VGRLLEGDEEGVALSVDLDATVALERRSQQAPVLRQRIRVAPTELFEQARRAGDVGEQQRDGPARQPVHDGPDYGLSAPFAPRDRPTSGRCRSATRLVRAWQLETAFQQAATWAVQV